MSKPLIVCICGSGRFWEEMAKQRRQLTLEGKIVVGPEVKADGSIDGDNDGSLKKTMLDELHFHKIDMADEVLVVDVDSTKPSDSPYTGESTNREILYSEKQGKPISRLSGRTSNSSTTKSAVAGK